MGNYGSKFAASEDKTSEPTSSIKCHYEILQVDQQATPDELKKAYRKQALLHHPDKNPHRQEDATAYFSQIQKAYEVLSDAQERAWYDRNREAILGRARQKKKQAASGNAPTLDDLMPYFNSGVYNGFGDDPKGFFTVYRKLFEVLEEFENDHIDDDYEEYDEEEHTSFGTRSTPVEPSLLRFYEKWLNFNSNRPFLEVESYKCDYADNRRVRRAMEKENERKREALRREFSETVRSLASFVRKRDPRWRFYQAEKQRERERADLARKEAVKERRRGEMEGFVEADWARKDLDDLQHAAREFFSSDDDEDNGDGSIASDEDELMLEDADEIYCDPCKKAFKTKLQWKNHEQSKKHKQALRKMGIRIPSNYYDEDQLEDQHGLDDNVVDESDSRQETLEQNEEQEEVVDEDDVESTSSIASEIPSDGEGLEALLERIRLEERGGRRPEEASSQKGPKTKKKAKEKGKPKDDTEKDVASAHKCTVCKMGFGSRNQLFKHVKEEGHAQAPSKKKKK